MSTPDAQNNIFLILITKLFSVIIIVGHIPTIWKNGLAIPVYKEWTTLTPLVHVDLNHGVNTGAPELTTLTPLIHVDLNHGVNTGAPE